LASDPGERAHIEEAAWCSEITTPGSSGFSAPWKSEPLPKPEHGAHDRRRLVVDVDGFDEGPVDLDLVERKRPQIGQRRIPGVEIIHRDPYPEQLGPAQRRERAVEVADQRGLGDLELEPFRLEPGLDQDLVQRMGEVRVVDLNGREVDGDGQILRPRRGLLAGFAEHPLAHLQDDAALLCNRNEDVGRNVAAGRMLPAQQRLESDGFAGADILLRLVDEPKLVARDGVAQLELEQAPVADLGAHGRFEEAIGGAPVFLGAVERGVRVVEQRLAIGRIVGADGDADAARHQRVILG
jgi:hypothetical protein